MTRSVFVISLCFLALAGCGSQGDERLAEKARIEGRAQVEAQSERAALMEADLERRQQFFQSVSGTYEGLMQTDQAEYCIRLTFIPTLAPYPAAGRVRSVEEIAHDLNTLSFNVQVVQWNPASPLSAVGCRVEGVRPDLANGLIHIASEGCPNFYALRVAKVAGTLEGEVHPTTNAQIFRFTASKTRSAGL